MRKSKKSIKLILDLLRNAILKQKNIGSGKHLYDLIFDALDESAVGRSDFKGTSAYEVARRIRAKDTKFDDHAIENALEELVKTGIIKKVERQPFFSKENILTDSRRPKCPICNSENYDGWDCEDCKFALPQKARKAFPKIIKTKK